MDSKIWKEFPEELMESVVARLPFAVFLRFRSVCRSWNSLPASPTFVQLSEQVAHQKQPWFFAMYFKTKGISGSWRGALYDPCMKKWHYDYPYPCFHVFYPVCSDGGLVCYSNYLSSTYEVGNPLTRTWKKLPFSAKIEVYVHNVGMGSLTQHCSSVISARGYKIVRVCSNGQYEVYDSFKESACTGRVPSNILLLHRLSKCESLSIGSVVYFLCENDGIVSYDVLSGVSDQLLIPTPPNSSSLCLAECGGDIFLVGLVGNNSSSVRVWKLQRTMLAWKEVAKMPNSWDMAFLSGKTEVRCFGNRRLLVISLNAIMMLLEAIYNRRFFMYDVVSREWSELPQLF